jgi:hypothetical protein
MTCATMRAPLRRLAAMAATLALAACLPAAPPPAALPPAAPAAAATPAPTPESQAARSYYARVQANLLAQGLMRSDGGGPDTPFTADDLARNFARIALYDEYVNRGGVLVAEATESRLRRWERPIRLAVEFGPSVPDAQRVKDTADIAAYAQRLSGLTGLPIRMDDRAPNFHILILNEDEREAAGPRLEDIVPGIDPAAIRATVAMPPASYCVVFAFSSGRGAAYTQAVAVIRGEHPDLLRLLCIHEELAQGLGLANDSPAARPSIFNDDEEFALLTRQDELMLRMLYDRRLAAGMTPEMALPVIETIAAELVPGES